MKRKILTVVGARPNFIKITQFERVFALYPDEFEYRLLHTGQHFDANMSKIFFEQLKLRQPDYHLNIKGGTQISQIGRIVLSFEEVMNSYQPDLVLVVGDVNSTFATGFVAHRMGAKLAHVESGLRSRDWGMPEEVNRILTDRIADICFVTEKSGQDNLLQEGKTAEQIHFVGNTMIDTLVAFDAEIQATDVLEKLNVTPKEFVLVTMHRPATVDHLAGLEQMLAILELLAKDYTVVFPVHPRTRKRLETFGLSDRLHKIPNIRLGEPMGYLSFQKLIASAQFILTDSGGIQEETTFRQIPCLTFRPNTERPSTIELGTNELIDFDLDKIKNRIAAIEKNTFKPSSIIPPLWDGKASERIVEVLRELW